MRRIDERRRASFACSAALLAASAVGCGTASPAPVEGGAEEAAASGGEATRPAEPAARGECEGSELSGEHGRTRDMPLEWGDNATRDGREALWRRLLCPSGARVSLRRVGSVGAAEQPSAAPRCGRFGEQEGDIDIIDRWEASCPGEPSEVWYMNAYRCGSSCPPEGFALIPEEAIEAHDAAMQAVRGRQMDLAVQHARRALALAPRAELLNALMGDVLFGAGRAVEAREYLERAVRARPSDPYYRLHLAMTHQADSYARYAAILHALRAELPQEHELYLEIVCRDARSLRREGRIGDAIASAEEACSGGYTGCCGFGPVPD